MNVQFSFFNYADQDGYVNLKADGKDCKVGAFQLQWAYQDYIRRVSHINPEIITPEDYVYEVTV